MTIKQSVVNTFNRVGIDYQKYMNQPGKVTVFNRFGNGSCVTTALVAHLIDWVYQTSNQYEMGVQKVNVSDFDRIRYFILDVDQNAYNVCID